MLSPHAAIPIETEQTRRTGVHGGCKIGFSRQWHLQQRVGMAQRISARTDRDLCKMFPRRAVQMHMATREQGEHMSRPDKTGGRKERGLGRLGITRYD